jgi:hypothetical protein
MRQNGRTRLAAVLIAGGAMAVVVAGCGGSGKKFANDPRPPVPTQLTGVISDKEVTVSPSTLPLPPLPGEEQTSKPLDTPIVLIISNQTDQSHTVTLTGKTRDGRSIEARTPPINPLDTAQIQQTLPPGSYQVKAGSARAVDPGEEIAAASLTVKPNHQTSSDTLLLP